MIWFSSSGGKRRRESENLDHCVEARSNHFIIETADGEFLFRANKESEAFRLQLNRRLVGPSPAGFFLAFDFFSLLFSGGASESLPLTIENTIFLPSKTFLLVSKPKINKKNVCESRRLSLSLPSPLLSFGENGESLRVQSTHKCTPKCCASWVWPKFLSCASTLIKLGRRSDEQARSADELGSRSHARRIDDDEGYEFLID